MSTITEVLGSKQSLGSFNSLASATYVVVGTITHSGELDCWLEVTALPGTVSSMKQVSVFAQRSLDGTNFESGPTSGITVTDETNLAYIGAVPCNSNSTAQNRVFSLRAAYGGEGMPYASKIIAKNETGASLSGSGNAVNYARVSGSVV